MRRTRSAMQKGYKNQLSLKSPGGQRKISPVGNRYALTGRTSPSHHLAANAPASLPLDTAPVMASAPSGPDAAAVAGAAAAAALGSPNSAGPPLPLLAAAVGLGGPQPVRMNRSKWQTVINDQKLRRELDDVIELDDLAQMRSILDKKPNLAHAPNEDGLMAVDLAILLERFTVAKVLIQNGAVNSDLLYDFATLEAHVTRLQDEAALSILQLTARMFSTSQSVKGFDKDLRVLDKRHKRLKAIRTYLATIGLPPPPDDVTCEVRSQTSVRVTVHSAQESSVILALRYKVEWSERADFADSALQCAIVNSTQATVSHLVSNLRKGRMCYLRAQVYSLRGWSAYAYPKNSYVVLNSWTDFRPDSGLQTQTPSTLNTANTPARSDKKSLSVEHSSDEYAATFLMEFDKLFCTITKSKSPLVCKKPMQETCTSLNLAVSFAPSSASVSSNTLSTSAALNASNSSLSSIGAVSSLQVPTTAGTTQKETGSNNGFRWFTSGAASYKLSKSIKRGTYLCFVIYNDCRIASTTDELLPLILIDQHTPNTNPNNELAALQKYVTDIHLLKMVLKCLTRLSIPSSLEFRVKALSIIAEFLSALEPAASPPSGFSYGCSSAQSFSVCMSNRVITNTGHRDSVIFVCCVNCDACGKDASLPSGLKWCPYTRLLKRRPALSSHTMAVPMAVTPSSSSQNLMADTQGQTASQGSPQTQHTSQLPERTGSMRSTSNSLTTSSPQDQHRMSVTVSPCIDDQADIYSCLLTRLDDIVTCAKRLGEPLSAGLYLGYVKIRMTIDQMRLICSKQQPLIIPTVKMRDNPHVTKEEWQSLHLLKAGCQPENTFNQYELSIANDFRDMLATAARKLHKFVVVGQQTTEVPANHSLYINEVIELNDQVSLILLIPPTDEVFAMSSTLDLTINASRTSHLTEIHLANFEILCAQIYGTSKQQRAIALLSAIDLSIAVIQHVQRSVLQMEEVRAIKNGCEKILAIQSKLDEYWRAQRWLIDILGRLRDRSKRSGTLTLLSVELLRPHVNDDGDTVSKPPDDSADIPDPPHSTHPSTPPPVHRTPVEVKRCASATPAIVFNRASLAGQQGALPDILPICDAALKVSNKQSDTGLRTSNVELSKSKFGSSENCALKEENENVADPAPHNAVSRAASSDASSSAGTSGTLQKTNAQDGKVETNGSQATSASEKSANQSAETNSDGNQSETGQVIRVHIAYYSGLDEEAINVTVRLVAGLTVREILSMIVRYVNHLAHENNADNPFYTEDELESFYMVVVAANKEIVLRDSFCPIDLRPPFSQGKFYISRRLKEFRSSVETML